MKKSYLILSLFILPLLGCNEANKAYKIDRTEFFSKVKTVGIVPIYISSESNIPNLEEKKKEFDDAIESKMKQAGFTIVPACKYKVIYDSIKQSLGIIDDSNDVSLRQKQYELLFEHSKKEYLAKYKVDALIYPAVVIVKVPWSRNNAEWHGVKEPTTGKRDILTDLFITTYGTIPGISLRIIISDNTQKPYYVNYGGIQLLSWLKGREFVEVPKEQLLADKEKNRRSVEIACRPLMPSAEQKSSAQ